MYDCSIFINFKTQKDLYEDFEVWLAFGIRFMRLAK